MKGVGEKSGASTQLYTDNTVKSSATRRASEMGPNEVTEAAVQRAWERGEGRRAVKYKEQLGASGGKGASQRQKGQSERQGGHGAPAQAPEGTLGSNVHCDRGQAGTKMGAGMHFYPQGSFP